MQICFHWFLNLIIDHTRKIYQLYKCYLKTLSNLIGQEYYSSIANTVSNFEIILCEKNKPTFILKFMSYSQKIITFFNDQNQNYLDS